MEFVNTLRTLLDKNNDVRRNGEAAYNGALEENPEQVVLILLDIVCSGQSDEEGVSLVNLSAVLLRRLLHRDAAWRRLCPESRAKGEAGVVLCSVCGCMYVCVLCVCVVRVCVCVCMCVAFVQRFAMNLPPYVCCGRGCVLYMPRAIFVLCSRFTARTCACPK